MSNKDRKQRKVNAVLVSVGNGLMDTREAETKEILQEVYDVAL